MLERSLEPHQRQDTARGVGARSVFDQLARLRAARAGDVEPTWLEVLADVDAEWRSDRGDRNRDWREHAKDGD